MWASTTKNSLSRRHKLQAKRSPYTLNQSGGKLSRARLTNRRRRKNIHNRGDTTGNVDVQEPEPEILPAVENGQTVFDNFAYHPSQDIKKDIHIASITGCNSHIETGHADKHIETRIATLPTRGSSCRKYIGNNNSTSKLLNPICDQAPQTASLFTNSEMDDIVMNDADTMKYDSMMNPQEPGYSPSEPRVLRNLSTINHFDYHENKGNPFQNTNMFNDDANSMSYGSSNPPRKNKVLPEGYIVHRNEEEEIKSAHSVERMTDSKRSRVCNLRDWIQIGGSRKRQKAAPKSMQPRPIVRQTHRHFLAPASSEERIKLVPGYNKRNPVNEYSEREKRHSPVQVTHSPPQFNL